MSKIKSEKLIKILDFFSPSFTKIILATFLSLPILTPILLLYSYPIGKIMLFSIGISLKIFVFSYTIACVYIAISNKRLFFWRQTLFIIGLLLLSINFLGLFISLRNPNIYQTETYFKNDIELTEEEFYANIKKKDTENNEEFIIRANSVINKSIAHPKKNLDFQKYNAQIPFWENYILATFSYFIPNQYRIYEFCNYKKAVERGLGECGQHAVIASEIFHLNNINSKIIYLRGLHVINYVQVSDNNWWLFDSDFGVIIKHSLEEIKNHPSYIEKAYLAKGYQKNLNYLISAYLNPSGENTRNIFQYNNVKEYCRSRYYLEKISYILIWLIPIILLLPFSLKLIKKYENINNHSN